MNIAFLKATPLWSPSVCCWFNRIMLRIPMILKIQATIKTNWRKIEIHSFTWKKLILWLFFILKKLLKLCLFLLRTNIRNHRCIHNCDTIWIKTLCAIITNYQKSSHKHIPSPFSHSSSAVREASTLKQIPTMNIDLKPSKYTLLKKLDIGQLLSGSNLSTFIQHCV